MPRSAPRYGTETPRGQVYIAITVLSFLVAFICLGLRVWAKRMRRRPFYLHDYLIFAAGLVSCGYFVISIYVAHPGGLGLHITQVEQNHPAGIKYTLLAFFISKPVWVTTTTLTKLSILHLQASIFETKNFRICAWVVAALSLLFWLAYFLESFVLCHPMAYAWDKTITYGHCGSQYGDTLGPPTVNMILDLIITVLPMPSVWALQMPRQKKVYLSCVLGLGLAICAMNIARIVYVAVTPLDDFTFILLLIALFATLETYIGIVVACLPTFGPLIWREKISTSGRNQHVRSGGQSSRFRNKRGESRDFERLYDDQYPLTTLSPPHSNGRSTVIASTGGSRDDTDVISTAEDAIKVKTDLQVFRTNFSAQHTQH